MATPAPGLITFDQLVTECYANVQLFPAIAQSGIASVLTANSWQMSSQEQMDVEAKLNVLTTPEKTLYEWMFANTVKAGIAFVPGGGGGTTWP
jgi:hypothetical protein